MKWLSSVMYCTLFFCLIACGDEGPDALDCRNVGRECNADFVCRMNASGTYECLAPEDSMDAGAAPDMEPEADSMVPPMDSELSDDAQSVNDAMMAPDAETTADAEVVPDAQLRATIEGRQMLIGDEPIHLKGVTWNPVPRGAQHPQGIDYRGFVEQDAALMQAAGINVVRTMEAIMDTDVLDILWAHNIYVMTTVYAWGGAPVESVIAKINATRDHPAVLTWVVGNEWNYNRLYTGLSFDEAVERVGQVARLVKETDPTRPVVTIYGEVPDQDIINRLPEIDAWGLNVYRGLVFGDLFDTFARRSGKPMFVSEYGADAYNANINAEDQAAQAEATRVLTEIIVSQSAFNGGPCIGGLIFEWADEWWKAPGDPNVHDIGGSAPGGGPHPDAVFNEEWWGLVDINRVPRAAYEAYRDAPGPSR